jgi:transposase
MLDEDGPLLLELAKKCKNAKEHNRYLALHAVSEGYEIPLIAKIFCVDADSIYNWTRRWEEEKTLEDKPRSGKPPAFSEAEKREMKRLIDENDRGLME